MVFETFDKDETNYIDTDVTRGVSYYYAVTAMDDGTQNTDGLVPGQRLESSRYVNRTGLPDDEIDLAGVRALVTAQGEAS